MIHRERVKGLDTYAVNLRGKFLPGRYTSEYAAILAQRFCECHLEIISKRTGGVASLSNLRHCLGVTCIVCKQVANL